MSNKDVCMLKNRTKRIHGVILGLLLAGATPQATAADFEQLFREYDFQHTTLSPAGTYVAYERGNELRGGNPQYGYRVLHTLKDGSAFGQWGWVDDTTLLVELKRTSGRTAFRAIKLRPNRESGRLSLKRRYHTVEGYIDDFLPNKEARVRFARVRSGESGRKVDLYEFDVFDKKSDAFRRVNRIDIGKARLQSFVKDTSGEMLSGFSFDFDEQRFAFWRRDSRGEWSSAWTFDKTHIFRPIATTNTGSTLLVVTDMFTPRPALVELDAENGSLLRIVVEHPVRSIHSGRSGADGYMPDDIYLSGLPVEERKPLQPQLRDALASVDLGNGNSEQRVALLGYSRNYDVLLVRTFGSGHPGTIQRCFVAERRCESIGSMAPWLDAQEPVSITQLENVSDRDSQFRPILRKPADAPGKLPLIVMPIDLRAQNYHPDIYDDGVRALVRNGFAVLQLNYSPEEGNGSDLTLTEWLAASAERLNEELKVVLDRHPNLDRERICSWATGIDAFVAIDFAIRYPDRRNCVTVFEPITDLSLLMSEKDQRSKAATQRIVEDMLPLAGLTDRELAAASVAFRHASLHANVYLSHSGTNRDIDPEHMWRLFQLLRLRGVPIEIIELEDKRPDEEVRDRQIDRFEPFIQFLEDRFNASSEETLARHLSPRH